MGITLKPIKTVKIMEKTDVDSILEEMSNLYEKVEKWEDKFQILREMGFLRIRSMQGK